MLSIRRATSDADRLAVTAVAHAASGPEKPLEHFQALRLAHPRRAEATWWLLEAEGSPVCSLVCHPLTLAHGGRVIPAYGLGAVSTAPAARRRGHAATLCAEAMTAAEREGRHVGLLYSAIAPAYYERLAFRTLPAWQHVAEDLARLAASGARATLTPLDPRRQAVDLADLWEAHAGSALHVFRDASGFERSIRLNPDDLYFGVGEPRRGYLRLCLEGDELEVTELIVPEDDVAPVLRAAADLAVRLKAMTLVGWVPPCAELAAHFRDQGRAKTLPMVRGLAPETTQLWPSDYF